MTQPHITKRGDRNLDVSEAASSRAPSLVEKLMENIKLEEDLSPKLTLKRFLSIESIVSTSSSFVKRQQASVGTMSNFRSIGAGSCGKVYEIPGTVDIVKVANYPGKSTDKLWNDFLVHIRVSEVFDRIGRDKIEVHVPRVKYFVSSGDEEFWNANIDRFPIEDRQMSNLLCAERILPLAKPIRESLIETYCPSSGIEAMKRSESNKDCLVRLYLGKRRTTTVTKFFQLRNFTLFLDQMEELELEVSDFASHIADALAIMHWAVGVDANDVEFVLGSAPDRVASAVQIVTKPITYAEAAKMAPNSSTWASHLNDFKRRVTHIWMLDFNRCEEFPKNATGVQQLVQTFFRNDPYFPRPLANHTKDQQLWATFRSRYLFTSKAFVNKAYPNLPQVFIDAVVEEQRARMEQRSSGN